MSTAARPLACLLQALAELVVAAAGSLAVAGEPIEAALAYVTDVD